MGRKKASISSAFRHPGGRLSAFGVPFGPTPPRPPDGKNEDEGDRGHDADKEDSRIDPEEGLRPPTWRGSGRWTGGHIARCRVEHPHVAASVRGIDRCVLVASTRR